MEYPCPELRLLLLPRRRMRTRFPAIPRQEEEGVEAVDLKRIRPRKYRSHTQFSCEGMKGRLLSSSSFYCG